MNKMKSTLATHLIFGLGKSGLSCARYFDRINQDYYLIDTRVKPPGSENLSQLTNCIGHRFGVLESSLLDDCTTLVVSPGIALTTPLIVEAIARGIDVCGDVELFARNCKKKVVAITGSNGKSTVTDLTERLINRSSLKAQKGGNIGLPVLDFLPEDEADVYVLELSSFQLDTTTSLKSEVSVCLNVSEDHLDRYKSFDDYAFSKQKIFRQSKHQIFNIEDNLTYPKNIAANDLSFGIDRHDSAWQQATSYLKYVDKNYVLMINGRAVVSTEDLNVTGIHNWLNVLVSLSILELLNLEIDQKVLAELADYRGLEHRFQLVSRMQNCIWINDSKATNVGATIAAINSLEPFEQSQIFLIAGGDSKNADLSQLKQPFESHVDCLVLFGKDAARLGSVSNLVKTIYVSGLQQAVSEIKKLAKDNDVVLLSPACASLDMFNNFEERGNTFVSAIEDCA